MDEDTHRTDLDLALEAARAYLRTCLLEAAKAAHLVEQLTNERERQRDTPD